MSNRKSHVIDTIPRRIEEDGKACVHASGVPHMTDDMRHPKITQNFLQKTFANGAAPCFCRVQNRYYQIGIFYLKLPAVDRSLAIKRSTVP